ncbi:MAG TPA: hypothetical protein VLA74_11830 [Nitrososphaeraceae archaeon]|nr:hypothetical protein [Nitrososphaeraceae archaeon]
MKYLSSIGILSMSLTLLTSSIIIVNAQITETSSMTNMTSPTLVN